MAFEKIAQQKIQEAIEAGAFDNLPNAGEKLDLESYFGLPPHLRMAYSVLKSANCVPQEIELLNEGPSPIGYRLSAIDSPPSAISQRIDRPASTHPSGHARA